MSTPQARDINHPAGGTVRLSGNMLLVYEAIEVCLRRRTDATAHEVLEVLEAQLSRPLQANAYSGRFADLCELGLLEASPERRDDAKTLRQRAMLGKAARVKAWRLPAMQRRLLAA